MNYTNSVFLNFSLIKKVIIDVFYKNKNKTKNKTKQNKTKQKQKQTKKKKNI